MKIRSHHLAALLLAVTACGPMRHNAAPPAVIIFDNQSTDQADVFAVRGAGDRVRIGTVFAGRKETLNLPSSLLAGDANVTIVARILASRRTPGTGQIALRSGDRVRITLAPQGNVLTVLPAIDP